MNRGLRQLIIPVFMTALPVMFAASGPPPLQVEGVVEVINDVLRQPYAESGQDAASAGLFGTQAAQVKFDIPAGKRLIVESITVRVSLTTGQVPSVQVWAKSNSGGTATADIPLTPQGESFNTTAYGAAIPLKLRVDGSSSTFDLTFTLFRSVTTGAAAILRVAVFGYLVDIP
jgi:hypothetical protein